MTSDNKLQDFAIVLSCNVGSLGHESNLSESNKTVRRNLLDQITYVRDKYKTNNIVLALQETGGYDAKLSPHFNGPKSTDERVTTGRYQGGKRGVAIYANEMSEDLKLDDNHVESAACITKIANKKRRSIRKIMVSSIYRNIHRTYGRLEEDVKSAMENIIAKGRQKGAELGLILGDFNSNDFDYKSNGYREIFIYLFFFVLTQRLVS